MTNATCRWLGCDSTSIQARGLCDRDYRRAQRGGTLASFAVTQKTCGTCGKSFPAGKHGKRYCSTPCREIGRIEGLAAKRKTRLESRRGRICLQCGNAVPDSRRKDAGHCSTACQQAAWYEAEAKRLRVASRLWARANRERRNEAEQRRRARKFGAGYEYIDREQLWVESGGACGICREPIDPTLRHPEPDSGSLDHIVPLSRGGAHCRENVQLTHLVCNLKKGVKVTPAKAVI